MRSFLQRREEKRCRLFSELVALLPSVKPSSVSLSELSGYLISRMLQDEYWEHMNILFVDMTKNLIIVNLSLDVDFSPNDCASMI